KTPRGEYICRWDKDGELKVADFREHELEKATTPAKVENEPKTLDTFPAPEGQNASFQQRVTS
ncbi:hypothetical protein, partial [Gluconobacter cerevisiae]